MKVSLNWIKKYSPVDLPLELLVEKIGAQLGAVEEVIDLGKMYEGIVVAKVVLCEKHPDASKLSICFIDDGRKVKGVDRNKDGLIQVVCGASNVSVGQLVAWIPPGVTVPATRDKDPLVLENRHIRGALSHGMLASPKELALGDSHEGILVIEEKAKPGDDFAKVYELDDFVIDIENKMFTHRPDLFGMLGVAREIAGINGKNFVSPVWYKEKIKLPLTDDMPLQIKNSVPQLVPRFSAAAIANIDIRPSPAWLQSYLVRGGIKPVNNIVDITNYLMLETAQPLHAYDYDKVKTGILGTRLSKDGEGLKLLGGKAIKLKAGMVVITDGQKPIGLGGVMGGADTEVDGNTKAIILEVANFDMNATRRTAMTYGLFTDAATRFTKGQSPRQNAAVLNRAIQFISDIAGGVTVRTVDDNPRVAVGRTVKTTAAFINQRLGENLSATQMKKLLENVEFTVGLSGDKLNITSPFWRTDIEIAEDIVEEVGRLYGWDHLPLALPQKDLAPAGPEQLLRFKSRLRDIMASAGGNEILSYSFVHESLLKIADQDPKDAFHIRNAISPDLQYYRLSLTPSLLEKIHPNVKAGYDKFALYEIGKAHSKKHTVDKDGVPTEIEVTAAVITDTSKLANKHGAAYYQARTILDYVAAQLGIDLIYSPVGPKEAGYTVMRPFEPSRSAMVSAATTGAVIGVIGEYKTSIISSLKLPLASAGFELGTNELMANAADAPSYQPLNKYPELEQDICLKTKAQLGYGVMTTFVRDYLSKVASEKGYGFRLQPIDIFQRGDDLVHKQTTWRISLWHPERTLTTKEANRLLDDMAVAAKNKLSAERI